MKKLNKPYRSFEVNIKSIRVCKVQITAGVVFNLINNGIMLG